MNIIQVHVPLLCITELFPFDHWQNLPDCLHYTGTLTQTHEYFSWSPKHQDPTNIKKPL